MVVITYGRSEKREGGSETSVVRTQRGGDATTGTLEDDHRVGDHHVGDDLLDDGDDGDDDDDDHNLDHDDDDDDTWVEMPSMLVTRSGESSSFSKKLFLI